MASAFAGMVDALYESAAEGSWAPAMRSIANKFGAHAALVYSCDKSSKRLFQDSVDQIGFDPAMLDEYSRYYIHRNVWSQNERRMPEGKAVSSSMLYPDSDLKKTEYYNGWLRRQDIFYGIGGLVNTVDGVATKLTFVRPERRGAFEAGDLRQMARLMPHFRAASQVRSRVQRYRQVAANALAAFEMMPFGVILVNSQATVMHLSNKAVPLTCQEGPLSLDREGRLAATTPRQTAALRQSITCAAQLRQGRQQMPQSPPLVLVTPEGRAVSVTVAPLDIVASLRSPQGPWVAIFLDVSEAKEAANLRDRYGLTAAEAELATLIAAGGRPKEIAARRGVSINTVRTQLASCLHKLNVNRQADLVRLVSQFQAEVRPSIINLSDACGGR